MIIEGTNSEVSHTHLTYIARSTQNHAVMLSKHSIHVSTQLHTLANIIILSYGLCKPIVSLNVAGGDDPNELNAVTLME